MPKFSIVIPTTRPYLVRAAIRSALAQDFEDFELLVSDNSTEGCKKVVDGFKDQRIRYVRPTEILAVAEHWDFAFSNACGDWQLLLCDDDALSPNLLSILSHDIITYPEAHTIRWKSGFWKQEGSVATQATSTFIVPGFSGKRTLFASRKLIAQMFNCGIALESSVKKFIPILSFSAYSKEIIGKIRNATGGQFCLPICPMTSSSLAALALSEKMLNIDLPLSILGSPLESQAAMASTPERYEQWISAWEFQFTPKQTMFTPTATHTETMLRIQSLLPAQLGGYQVNWEEFFMILFRQVMAGDWNMPKKKSLARLESALEEFPIAIQTSVHAYISQPKPSPSRLQSLRRTVLRKARNAPVRVYNALKCNKYYRDQALNAHKYGLNDINDCARMLSKITT